MKWFRDGKQICDSSENNVNLQIQYNCYKRRDDLDIVVWKTDDGKTRFNYTNLLRFYNKLDSDEGDFICTVGMKRNTNWTPSVNGTVWVHRPKLSFSSRFPLVRGQSTPRPTTLSMHACMRSFMSCAYFCRSVVLWY
jgi:hypothetical protein